MSLLTLGSALLTEDWFPGDDSDCEEPLDFPEDVVAAGFPSWRFALDDFDQLY